MSDDPQARARTLLAQLAATLAELSTAVDEALRQCVVPGTAVVPVPIPVPSPPPVANPARFLACLEIVLRHEGGFVNHPSDPGGATNMGITKDTLEEWRKRPVSVAEVRLLTKAEAAAIYEAKYYLRHRCDAMPAGVDLCILDFAVNSGGAIKAIQKCLGVRPDGAVGPVTLAAMAEFEPGELVENISALRVTYLRALPIFPTFGRGWLARVEDTRIEALRMVERAAAGS